MRYKGLETSVPLLLAYEALALAHMKAPHTRGWRDKLRKSKLDEKESKIPEEIPSRDYANYDQSFALLVVNASIIEGTLRTLLSEKVSSEIDVQTEKGVWPKAGKSHPSLSCC